MVWTQPMSETKEALHQTFKITEKVWSSASKPLKEVRMLQQSLSFFSLYSLSEILLPNYGTAGYTGKVVLGMDVAASEFYKEDLKKYDLDFKTKNNDGKSLKTADEMVQLYKEFVRDVRVSFFFFNFSFF
jgi:enolase